MIYYGLIFGLILLAVVFVGIIFLAGIFISLQSFLITTLQGFFSAAPSVAGLVGFALLIWLVIRFVLKFSGANKFFGWSIGIMFAYLFLSQTWVSMLTPEVRTRFNLASKSRTNEAVQNVSDGMLSGVEDSRIYVAKSDLVAYLDPKDLSKIKIFPPKTVFYRLRETVPSGVFLSEADYFVKETDGRPGHFLASGERVIILLSDLENVKISKEKEEREKALTAKEQQRQEIRRQEERRRIEAERRKQASILNLFPKKISRQEIVFDLPADAKYGDRFEFMEAVPLIGAGGGSIFVGNHSMGSFSSVIPAGFNFRIPPQAIKYNGGFKLLIFNSNPDNIKEIKLKKKGGA